MRPRVSLLLLPPIEPSFLFQRGPKPRSYHRPEDGELAIVAGSALASLRLTEDHGFTTDAERLAFDQTPRIALRRSVAGPLRIDTSYNLTVED